MYFHKPMHVAGVIKCTRKDIQIRMNLQGSKHQLYTSIIHIKNLILSCAYYEINGLHKNINILKCRIQVEIIIVHSITKAFNLAIAEAVTS